MKPYQPISCSFYDELEARVTTGPLCTLTYRIQPDTPPSTYHGIIQDLFIRDKVEYLRLQDGFELRLDALVAVDDGSCGITAERDVILGNLLTYCNLYI